MAYDHRRAVANLLAFMMANQLREYPWEVESGVGPGTLRSFRSGKTRSLGNATLTKLAEGATRMTGRKVNVDEIRDAEASRLVKVIHRIGADAAVMPVEGAAGQAEQPPGLEGGAAYLVDGEAGMPLFESGDVLFAAAPTRDVAALLGKVAIVLLVEGKSERRLLRRLLRGGRKGRFHLLAPAGGQPLEDQRVASAAPIRWVRRAP